MSKLHQFFFQLVRMFEGKKNVMNNFLELDSPKKCIFPWICVPLKKC